MAFASVPEYLTSLTPTQRAACELLRQSIREALPDATECISYSLPAYRQDGVVVAGFGAFKNHVAYLPHSGHVLTALADALSGYTRTQGSLHVPFDRPLPQALVRRLIEVRMEQAGLRAAHPGRSRPTPPLVAGRQNRHT